jgi:hypothetical protein
MLMTISNVTSLPLPLLLTHQEPPPPYLFYAHKEVGNCLLSNLLPSLPTIHISQEQKDYVMQGIYTKLPPQEDQALLQVLWYTWQQLYKLSSSSEVLYFTNP